MSEQMWTRERGRGVTIVAHVISSGLSLGGAGQQVLLKVTCSNVASVTMTFTALYTLIHSSTLFPFAFLR